MYICVLCWHTPIHKIKNMHGECYLCYIRKCSNFVNTLYTNLIKLLWLFFCLIIFDSKTIGRFYPSNTTYIQGCPGKCDTFSGASRNYFRKNTFVCLEIFTFRTIS